MRFRKKDLAGAIITKVLKHPVVGPLALPLYHRVPKPFNAQVSLTYRCQCSCVHCSAETYREQGFAEPSTAQIEHIIDELVGTRAYKIYFFGGEPLLREDLFHLVDHARGRGFQTMLDTNGFLLNRETVGRLAHSGLTEIGVSIDSADPARHDAFRGVEGIFSRAVEGLRLCAEQGLSTYISTYATSRSLEDGDMAAIVALARSLGVKVRILSPIMAGRWQAAEEVKLNARDVSRLKGLLEEGAVYWESVACSTPDSPFVCTSGIRAYIYISTRGDVQPCNFIPVSFGNAHEEALPVILKRMWGSELFGCFHKTDNPSGCPMNEQNLGERIRRAVDQGAKLPVDFRELPE